MEDFLKRFIKSREKRIAGLARSVMARCQRKRTGAGAKRREYHNLYYWQNTEKRRQQRLLSHEQLGKAHRYTEQLKQEERRKLSRSSQSSTNTRESP
jgi:hypothetical protein